MAKLLNLTHTTSDGSLSYHNEFIIAQNSPNGHWCVDTVRLTLSQANKTLSGTWRAPDCGSGGINVTKSPIYVLDPFLFNPNDGSDLDLQRLLPTLSSITSVAASGLDADGTCAAIIVRDTAVLLQVTFTTNSGTILEAFRPSFLTKSPATSGDATLTVRPTIQLGALLYAVALVQAPPSGVTPSFANPIVVTAKQEDNQESRTSLALVPPPILLVTMGGMLWVAIGLDLSRVPPYDGCIH